jgi:hypothetical protein
MPGDINHDGTVDQQDLKLLRNLLENNHELLQHLSNEEKALLDINHDGHIDYDDVVNLCTTLLNANSGTNQDMHAKLTGLRQKLSR